jgi:hypothetical protein
MSERFPLDQTCPMPAQQPGCTGPFSDARDCPVHAPAVRATDELIALRARLATLERVREAAQRFVTVYGTEADPRYAYVKMVFALAAIRPPGQEE